MHVSRARMIMVKNVKELNRYFKTATKRDIEILLDTILLSERQETIFSMFYIKKYDIGFIADSLNVCRRVVNRELMEIRRKLYLII